MKPEIYIPKFYKKDLKMFLGIDLEPVSNGMLCGGVLSSFLLRNVKLIGYEEFFCCQYILNLVNQGAHCYLGYKESMLIGSLMPFLDIRMCSVRHGGMFRPRDILRHVKIPNTVLSSFLKYYFYVYLPNNKFSENSLNSLISCLRKDVDCLEINRLL